MSGRSLQRHTARWRRGFEFNVTAIAIHRGQFAKMAVRLLGSIVIVIAGHSGDAIATPRDNRTSTRRSPAAAPELAHFAEIAARSVLDRHPVSTDTLLCDPRLRRQLQALATRLVGNADAYSIRKHLLQLRKTRQLRRELVQRVADWDHTIDSLSVVQLIEALGADEISTGPGVYFFYDPTGYIYIGEAANRKVRRIQHISQSDRLTLNGYLHSDAEGSITVELHTFGDRSPAKHLKVHRAYESELIRCRQPRFNIRS